MIANNSYTCEIVIALFLALKYDHSLVTAVPQRGTHSKIRLDNKPYILVHGIKTNKA